MLPEGMFLAHAPTEEIEDNQRRFLVVSLVSQRRSAPDAAQILGLNELSIGIDLPDLPHRQLDRPALVDERADHLPFIARVRMPMPVERREAGGRQWLVDRGEGIDPRVALADRSRISRQVVGELRVERPVQRSPLPW